jgi:predicted transcriptional regulator
VFDLSETQMKILKFMTEATGRIDMTEFAHKMGLTSNQMMEQLQQMLKAGLLRKVSGGYTITEKGKNTLKSDVPVPSTMNFHFYNALSQPTGASAATIREFYTQIVKAEVVSLEFHLFRGDFENWFREAVNDAFFADELAKIKKTNLKGEDLRKAIMRVAEIRYGF